MRYYVIPPKRNAEFVAAMERVLALYHLPYDPEIPVVVMDEQPVQLLKETRVPIPATQHHAKRVDYEYDRAGVANIFSCLPSHLVVGGVLRFEKGRRFATIEELRKAVEAWMKMCNENQKGVRRQFNIEKARVKLHSLYPIIK